MRKNGLEQLSFSHDTASFAKALRGCLAGGIVAVDAQRLITVFNGTAAELTGLVASQALGRPVETLPSPLAQLLEETLTQGLSLEQSNLPLPGDGTTARSVHAHTALLLAVSGEPAGAVAVLNDLTFTHSLAQHLRRLDRLANVGTLSASMAHEIKNAMVAIRTFIEVLLEKHPDTELASIVKREMSRIDSLVSQMLKLANPAKPTFAPISLHTLLDQSLRLVQHQFENKAIAVHRHFDAGTDRISGDEYQLEQAFLNLFLNALEAMGPHGELQVRTETLPGGDEATVRVIVKDNGIGIPDENRSRLFEPFFTTKRDGTGLGLSITRRIVREHHGEISVESEPNRGTTFAIVLPVPSDTPAASPAA